MSGKVDFMVCEEHGAWYIDSLQVPDEVALQSNSALVEWAKREKFDEDPDVIFVGVYWRDSALDELGITKSAAVNDAYKVYKKRISNAGN